MADSSGPHIVKPTSALGKSERLNDGTPSSKTGSANVRQPDTSKVSKWTQTKSFLPKDAENYYEKTAFTILDVFTVLLPVLFIVLAILALRLDKLPIEDKNNYGDQIRSAMKLGPTTYPIIFIAVAATALARIARYKAERGISLGSLEQLIASRSLFNTLENQISQKPRFLGLLLIALWALSPIGGQASLRLLNIGSQQVISSHLVRYFSTNQSFASRSSILNQIVIESLYRSSILAYNSTINEPMDTWGNLKIPKIESLKSKADPNGWKTVDWSNPLFSSLIGLPLLNISHDGTMNFSIQSSYLTFDCQNLSRVNISETPREPLRNPQNRSGKYSSYDGLFQMPSKLPRSIFLASASYSTEVFENLSTPLHVVFAANDKNLTILGNFTVTQSRVESRVFCRQGQCQVIAMRPSREDTTSSYHTPLSKVPVADDLYIGFVSADSPDISGEVQPTARFIGSLSYTNFDSSGSGLSSVSESDITTRLALLFNTYLVAATVPRFLADTTVRSTEPYQPETSSYLTPSTSLDSPVLLVYRTVFFSRLAPATLTITSQIYAAQPVWIILLLISALVLFLLSLVGVATKYAIIAPEILGFVSSMTRDNEYFKLDPIGSTLDGFQRARLLRDLRVQIYDAEPAGETGRVVFGPLLDGQRKTTRLRRGREYW